MKHFFTFSFSLFLCFWATPKIQAQVYFEDFEGTFPGWVEFDNGIGTVESWVIANDGYNSDWAANISYEIIGGSNSQDWLVSPQITPTAGNTTLSFFQKQSYATDFGSVYTVRISTSSQTNPATFVTVNTQTETNFGTTYSLKTVDLSAYVNTPIYIAFVMTQDDGDDWFVDDVRVGPMPCLQPTNLTVYSITTTTANFSWTEINGSTNWEVAVIDANTSLDPSDIIACPFNPVMMTSLTPGTAYDFYVRSVCGTSRSEWTGPITFSTNCLATFTAPYTQSFNGDIIPPCWTQSGSEPWNFSTDAGYGAAAAGDHTGNGGNYAWIDGSAPSGASQISTLTSPRVSITPLLNPALYYRIFSHNTDGSDYNTVTVELFNGTAWQTIQTTQADLGAGWREYIINLNNYTITGAVQVRFTVRENAASGTFYNDILIDDVEFKEGPTCYEPTALTASGITTTTANLNWTPGDVGSTQWEVEIVTAGSTPTGAGITINARPYAAAGLAMATDYEYYVREVCGVGDNSDWVGPFFFTTLCGVFTAPYLETFNSASLPRCWSQSGSNNWTFSTAADYGAAAAGDHTGNGGRYAWMDGSSNDNGAVSTLITPQVNISTLTNPALRYFIYSNNTDNSVINTLTVEFFNGTSWTTVQTLQNNLGAGWFEVIINLSGYTITGPVQARFSVTGSSDFGAWYHDLLIDDVQFYDGPTCATPIALNALNVTTTADLTWGGGGTQWEIELVLATSPLTGVGTTVNAPLPYAVTGLQPGTTYKYAVRRVCGLGVYSTWSAPFTFTTACPSPLPGNTFATAIPINTITYTDSKNTSRCYTNTAAGPAADVWYQVILDNCTNMLNVSLCNSSFDTYLYLYEADGTTLLNLNDDACGTRSSLSQAVLPGSTVYILVEGFALEAGLFTLEVNQVSNVSAAFTYPAAAYCANAANPTATITGTTGGTFTSTAGLSLNSSTGEVNLAASTAGSYNVTYSVTLGACTQQVVQPITVNAMDNSSFSYAANTYCQNAANPSPTITGAAGGTFSSGAGLSINSGTGAINLAASTPNNYTVSYTTAGICPTTSTFNLAVTATPVANHSLVSNSIESCSGFGTVTSRLEIWGEDYDGFVLQRQWFDEFGTPQGSPQTSIITDNDNNNATPIVITKDTSVAASGYFVYTVNVIRCGIAGAPQTANSYIYVPTPASLVMNPAHADCYSTNRNAWIDFYDDAAGEPIASLLDFTAGGDTDTLKMTDVFVDFDAVVSDCNGDALGIRPRLQRFWQITPANNRPASVRLYLHQDELDKMAAHLGLPSIAVTDLNLWKFRDGDICAATPDVVPFTVVDFSASSNGYPNDKPFNTTAGVIGIEFRVASFSHFVLVPDDRLLATSFVSFDAMAMANRTVQLDWAIENPDSYTSFQWLRSKDAVYFEPVGEMPATSNQRQYQSIDPAPLSGVSYYYIKATKQGGEVEYTAKRAVNIETDTDFTLFPNPTQTGTTLHIRTTAFADGIAAVQIIDELGRVLEQHSITQSIGTQTYQLPIALPQGVYVLRWVDDTGAAKHRTFVVK